MPTLIPAATIARKRDGYELADAEIGEFIRRFTDGELPDYQMSALAMAIYFQGMSRRETLALTRALLESGTVLKWDTGPPRVDKHSTGGLGDKVSIILAPLLACCDVQVPMISGRGLGITGGTLDKLESIEGFRTDLSLHELQKVTEQIGCVITGASAELAPADKQLYALRDVTATVPSRPLIVASILSKKLAEGLDSLVFDVKVGSGAFMKTEEAARLLAQDLVEVGQQFGLPTTALLTDMSQPLGVAVGNAIEVLESLAVLDGAGPADVLELTLQLGSEVLVSSGICADVGEARDRQLAKISDGSAREKFAAMVAAQGGRLTDLALAPSYEVVSPIDGYLHAIDSETLGRSVIELGGGRRKMGDAIDHQVGVECLVRVGDQVAKGQAIAKVFARDTALMDRVQHAFKLKSQPTPPQPLLLDRITHHVG